ncbi:hypothetical protein DFH07DRAFT_770910 [Mycena maculata]|uniref:Uncharacterized protein n=1 Tax=Mycena maculata TaxID=230809 RepID=A0AAD7NI93_9AGAR|nr:hypothetical protein DFH07DRAFT_770910 [Mycena maculata]
MDEHRRAFPLQIFFRVSLCTFMSESLEHNLRTNRIRRGAPGLFILIGFLRLILAAAYRSAIRPRKMDHLLFNLGSDAFEKGRNGAYRMVTAHAAVKWATLTKPGPVAKEVKKLTWKLRKG